MFSCHPCEWHYKLVIGAITLLIGAMTPFITCAHLVGINHSSVGKYTVLSLHGSNQITQLFILDSAENVKQTKKWCSKMLMNPMGLQSVKITQKRILIPMNPMVCWKNKGNYTNPSNENIRIISWTCIFQPYSSNSSYGGVETLCPPNEASDRSCSTPICCHILYNRQVLATLAAVFSHLNCRHE